MVLTTRLATLVAVAATLTAAACDGKGKEAKGLPAAKDWSAPSPGMAGPGVGRAAPSDPHAGVPGAPALGGGGADPHAGVPGAPPLGGGGGGDPHAGVPGAPPLAGGGGGGDPHAGVPGAPPLGDELATGGGAMPVDQLGLPGPDPSRPIDASKFLGGTVDAPAGNRARIPAGAAIYLSVRPADASGNPAGMPIAVDKLTATGTWPLTFRITEAQAMVGGTAFAGPVVITARFDQDGEARSKQPGDISGTVKASIPQDALAISLDAIQP